MGAYIHPVTPEQKAAFEMGRWLIDAYIAASPDHQDPTLNKSTIVGDMIADLKYTMSRVWDYPIGDIEAVESAAFSSLTYNHKQKGTHE